MKTKRNRRTRDYSTTNTDAYKLFKKATNLTNIEKKCFTKVINEFNEGLVQHLIHTGEKVTLIHGLGTMHVRKKRSPQEFIMQNGYKVLKSAPIDWKATKEAGKIVRTQNFHTDGYRCTYVWGRSAARFLNSNCWIFEFCRTAKRGLAAHLKSGNARYSLDRYDEYIKY